MQNVSVSYKTYRILGIVRHEAVNVKLQNIHRCLPKLLGSLRTLFQG